MDSKTYNAVCRYLETGQCANLPWPQLKFYSNVCYIDQNGILRDRKTMLPIACKQDLNMIMAQAHISALNYHRNVDETISAITSHYVPNIRIEVSLFIDNCAFCTMVRQKSAELNEELITFKRQLQQEMSASGTTDKITLNLNGKPQTPTKWTNEIISPKKEELEGAESSHISQPKVELNTKEEENVKLREEVQRLQKDNAEMVEQLKKCTTKDSYAVKEEENRRLRDELDHSHANIDQLLQDVNEKDALIAALRNDFTLLQSEIAKVHSLWVQ